jgi:pantetheine-phosphate adenylyltransferase
MPNTIHALYPISGNPPSWGHADVMERSARIFDKVTWALAVNPDKKYLFTAAQRMDMMGEYIRHFGLNNVTVAEYQGATVRFAQRIGASVIVKGVRNPLDLQTEMEQAQGNHNIDPAVETVALFTSPRYSVINSTLIRELALLGEDIEPYVIAPVAQKVREILRAQGVGDTARGIAGTPRR